MYGHKLQGTALSSNCLYRKPDYAQLLPLHQRMNALVCTIVYTPACSIVCGPTCIMTHAIVFVSALLVPCFTLRYLLATHPGSQHRTSNPKSIPSLESASPTNSRSQLRSPNRFILELFHCRGLDCLRRVYRAEMRYFRVVRTVYIGSTLGLIRKSASLQG